MTYKIIRIDGKDDELTAQSFDKYSDAYDLLEELYGDLCCSDADYGDITYYDIVENNLINQKKTLFASNKNMAYKIIRIDGKDDELTAQSFNKYSDAYDLLNELYGDLCCSDADYGDITYYDIVENNLKNINGE